MTTPHHPPVEEPVAGARPPGAAPGRCTARHRVAEGASFVGVTATRPRRRVLRGRDPATGGRRRVGDGH